VVTPLGSVVDVSENAVYTGWSALFKELRRLGYVEGKNLIVERNSGGGQPERFVELAREVVHTGPDVIVTSGNALAMAFQIPTPTIPVVGVVADPVAYGLTTSVARPGGNFTGISVDAGIELVGKYLEMVRETVQGCRNSALLRTASRPRAPCCGRRKTSRPISIARFDI
jgi:ABC-type uncharacterized transport system substrate-binding protein